MALGLSVGVCDMGSALSFWLVKLKFEIVSVAMNELWAHVTGENFYKVFKGHRQSHCTPLTADSEIVYYHSELDGCVQRPGRTLACGHIPSFLCSCLIDTSLPHVIFTTEIPVTVARWHLYMETAPWYPTLTFGLTGVHPSHAVGRSWYTPTRLCCHDGWRCPTAK